jgi:hypothetical protein
MILPMNFSETFIRCFVKNPENKKIAKESFEKLCKDEFKVDP